jgi:hypothetical protein
VTVSFLGDIEPFGCSIILVANGTLFDMVLGEFHTRVCHGGPEDEGRSHTFQEEVYRVFVLPTQKWRRTGVPAYVRATCSMW